MLARGLTGPLLAYVFVAALIAAGLLIGGREEATTVVEPIPDGPADSAGLRAGDVILKVQSQPTPTWDQVRSAVKRAGDAEVQLEVQRGGEKLVLRPLARNGVIGIRPRQATRTVPLIEAAGEGLSKPARLLVSMFVDRARTAFSEPRMMGPIGIVRESREGRSLGRYLDLLGYLASYMWPLSLLVQLALRPRKKVVRVVA